MYYYVDEQARIHDLAALYIALSKSKTFLYGCVYASYRWLRLILHLTTINETFITGPPQQPLKRCVYDTNRFVLNNRKKQEVWSRIKKYIIMSFQLNNE